MDRLTEGSSWAGLAAMLQAISAFVPPTWTVWLHAATAAAAAIAVKLPDKGA